MTRAAAPAPGRKPIWVDLSELVFTWNPAVQYYGVARTVIEIGYEMRRLDPSVRFAIYSPGHRGFFEVFPKFGTEARNGLIDLSLPKEALPIRLRHKFPTVNPLRDAVLAVVKPAVRALNRRRWGHVPQDLAVPVDLSGARLFAAGRYKVIADYLTQMGPRARFDLVPLIHDVIPLHYRGDHFSESLPTNYLLDISTVIAGAHRIVTNSRFTAHELAHYSGTGDLPAPLPPVTPVPLVHQYRETDEPMGIDLPKAPYLLMVGTLPGRKNLECTLAALRQLRATPGAAPTLVLAGARSPKVDAVIDGQFADLKDGIVHVHSPNQTELAALYRNAFALVIASRIEGWGLPLGEALWLGTPGFAAKVPALEEVGGDLACFFDPEDPDTLAALVARYLDDPRAYAALKDRITAAKGSLRTWTHVAQEALEVLSAP